MGLRSSSLPLGSEWSSTIVDMATLPAGVAIVGAPVISDLFRSCEGLRMPAGAREDPMNWICKLAVTGIALLHLSSGIVFGQTTGGAEARLKERNIVLPAAAPVIGNYVYAVQSL